MNKEELTALCKKQEERIKELEDKIYGTLSDAKCEPAEPDYDELYRKIQMLSDKLELLENENKALRHSLAVMYMQLEGSQSREEMWQEDYYREHKRAEKLYEEVNKNDN